MCQVDRDTGPVERLEQLVKFAAIRKIDLFCSRDNRERSGASCATLRYNGSTTPTLPHAQCVLLCGQPGFGTTRRNAFP